MLNFVVKLLEKNEELQLELKDKNLRYKELVQKINLKVKNYCLNKMM